MKNNYKLEKPKAKHLKFNKWMSTRSQWKNYYKDSGLQLKTG